MGHGAKNRPDELSVGEVVALVRGVLAEALPAKIRVVGEVSNLSDSRQHWYFSLKDDQATLRCVCFAMNARRVGFPLANGMEVVATGRVDMYPAQGHVQLYVDRIEPVGQGALELQFRQLCDELRGLGYFAAEHKKALPLFPRAIAVVTSRGAAALQDVIDTARRRWAGCRLLLFDVRVQGEGAASEIAAALKMLSKHGPALGIDAVVLTRGGGSIEDLWAFNERVVADAVYGCRLPVVAAIGHETDTTVAELVADERCATPTQAAVRLVPDRKAVGEQLDHLTHKLRAGLVRRHEWCRQRLEGLAARAAIRRPRQIIESRVARLERTQERLIHAVRGRVRVAGDRLAEARRRWSGSGPRPTMALLAERLTFDEKQLKRLLRDVLDRGANRLELAAGRLTPAVVQRVGRSRERVDALERQLRSVGPQQVLERGYTYTLDADGKVLRRAGQAGFGDRITTVLADGRVVSKVEGSGEGDGWLAARPGAKKKAGKKKPSGGPGLFEGDLASSGEKR